MSFDRIAFLFLGSIREGVQTLCNQQKSEKKGREGERDRERKRDGKEREGGRGERGRGREWENKATIIFKVILCVGMK